MTAIEHPDAGGQTLQMRVDGMDCGACALKIETAVKRLPGVSDISVNFATGALVLTHDAAQTPRKEIEDQIRNLGYTPRPMAEAGSPRLRLPRCGRHWPRTDRAPRGCGRHVRNALQH